MSKSGEPKIYVLEPYRNYWRLRREGNRMGNCRGTREQMIRAAERWGWTVREEGRKP